MKISVKNYENDKDKSLEKVTTDGNRDAFGSIAQANCFLTV